MKKSLLFLLCTFFCSSYLPLEAKDCHTFQDRRYINSSAIHFDNNHIFIMTKQGVLEASALHHDSKGIYAYNSELIRTSGIAFCPYCYKVFPSPGIVRDHIARCHPRYRITD